MLDPGLYLAAIYGETEILLVAFKEIDLAHQHDNNASVCLSVAVRHKHIETVEALLQRGLPVDTPSYPYGHTALMGAVGNDMMDMVTYLLGKGADIHLQDYKGHNMLFFGVLSGSLEMVQFLLAQGVKTNQFDVFGMSALRGTFKGINPEIVELLSHVGEGLEEVDASGKTTREWAEEMGYLKVQHQ
jgi:ankyrin repeat protein